MKVLLSWSLNAIRYVRKGSMNNSLQLMNIPLELIEQGNVANAKCLFAICSFKVGWSGPLAFTLFCIFWWNLHHFTIDVLYVPVNAHSPDKHHNGYNKKRTTSARCVLQKLMVGFACVLFAQIHCYTINWCVFQWWEYFVAKSASWFSLDENALLYAKQKVSAHVSQRVNIPPEVDQSQLKNVECRMWK